MEWRALARLNSLACIIVLHRRVPPGRPSAPIHSDNPARCDTGDVVLHGPMLAVYGLAWQIACQPAGLTFTVFVLRRSAGLITAKPNATWPRAEGMADAICELAREQNKRNRRHERRTSQCTLLVSLGGEYVEDRSFSVECGEVVRTDRCATER